MEKMIIIIIIIILELYWSYGQPCQMSTCRIAETMH